MRLNNDFYQITLDYHSAQLFTFASVLKGYQGSNFLSFLHHTDIDSHFINLISRTIKISSSMFRLRVSPLNIIAFLLGFISYLVSMSTLPLIHKVGLLTILGGLTSSFIIATSKLNDNEEKHTF